MPLKEWSERTKPELRAPGLAKTLQAALNEEFAMLG